MDDHISIRHVRDNLAEVLRRVRLREERIAITRYGKVLGVLVPPAAVEAIHETERERDRADSINAIFAYLVNEDLAPCNDDDTDDATDYPLNMTRTAMKQVRALSPLRRRLIREVLGSDWRERAEICGARPLRRGPCADLRNGDNGPGGAMHRRVTLWAVARNQVRSTPGERLPVRAGWRFGDDGADR